MFEHNTEYVHSHKQLWERRQTHNMSDWLYLQGCDFTVHMVLPFKWTSSQICVWKEIQK